MLMNAATVLDIRFTKVFKNELEACVTALVPIGADCELNKISLKNLSDSQKNISLYSYVEFCLWNAVEDMNNFFRKKLQHR